MNAVALKNIKIPSLTEMIIFLALVVGLVLLVRMVWQKYLDNAAIGDNIDLAKNEAFTSTPVQDLAKKIPAADLPKAHTDLAKFDPIPIGRMIFHANGLFSHNPNEVYNAFARIKTQRELAYFVNYFNILAKVDLFTYLNGFMAPRELVQVNDIIKKLPLY